MAHPAVFKWPCSQLPNWFFFKLETYLSYLTMREDLEEGKRSLFNVAQQCYHHSENVHKYNLAFKKAWKLWIPWAGFITTKFELWVDLTKFPSGVLKEIVWSWLLSGYIFLTYFYCSAFYSSFFDLEYVCVHFFFNSVAMQTYFLRSYPFLPHPNAKKTAGKASEKLENKWLPLNNKQRVGKSHWYLGNRAA